MGATAPVFSLSGPSGVGKSTVLKRLISRGYIRVTPSTTRSRRNGESPNAYRFLTVEAYQRRLSDGEMRFSFFFFGNFYGYRQADIASVIAGGCVPILEMYTGFIRDFKRAFPRSCSLFLFPESVGLLEERMRTRGDDLHSIEKRLSYASQEINIYHQLRDWFDHSIVVENQDTVEAVEEKLLEVLSSAREV